MRTIIIDDTFAEGFHMKASRILITAENLDWAYHAGRAVTGFATSVIGCGVESGIERELSSDETPDGRVGIAVLFFAMNTKMLAKQIENRVGQAVMTCPTTAVFSGIDWGEEIIPLGKNVRFFGDGDQISKKIGDKRYWRIPVMDGEFLIEETTCVVPAVGGGNFLICAESQRAGLQACEIAVSAIKKYADVIMPFPGGVVRSGSKVGSKYPKMFASTNTGFCPTLKGMSGTLLDESSTCVLEIVIDGLSERAVYQAMQAGIEAVMNWPENHEICKISAGNYGGNLGQFKFYLRMCQTFAH